MRFTKVVTAAVAALGYKFNDGENWEVSPVPRVITGIALTGSAVVADTAVKVMVGNIEYAEKLFNSSTGLGCQVKDLLPCWCYIPAGAPLEIEVVDAALTNDVALEMDIQVAPMGMAWQGGHLVEKNVTAATAAVDYDFAEGENWQKANHYRRLVHAGVVGSTAIGDCAVEIGVGSAYFGTLYNTTAGASKIPLVNLDVKLLNCHIPPSELLSVKVVDAAATQEMVLFANIMGAPVRVAGGRTRYNSRRGGYRRRY